MIWVVGVFALLWVQGLTIGLSDDEAYYWALSQRPALAYGFHPPAVAWVIALARAAFGPLLGDPSVAVTRLPAAILGALTFALLRDWARRSTAATTAEARFSETRFALLFLALPALAGAGWMIVPDLPLFLGIALLYVGASRVSNEAKATPGLLATLFLGSAIAVLSKYSGVLAVGSALGAIALHARGAARTRSLAAVLGGLAAGATPVLIWNAQNEWGSLLYQIQSRHYDPYWSWNRYRQFIVSQLILAGPGVIVGAALLLGQSARDRLARHAWLFALPAAAVFFTQPIWYGFKPHWALAAWLPIHFELTRRFSWGGIRKLAYVQIGLGYLVVLAFIVTCHLPIITWITGNTSTDVTNDFLGWDKLGSHLSSRGLDNLPVVGSRYQTAGQASFALGSKGRVTFIPREKKEWPEWPDLGITEGLGPEWPRLTQKIVFVADSRYTAGPEFKQAKCDKDSRLETTRWGHLSKWVDVWVCVPSP